MNRRLLATAAALVVAATGAIGVVSYARTADQRALAGQQAVQVFVAEKKVPVGTTAGKALAQGLIVRKLIARAALPDGVLTTVDGHNDQLVATSVIQPGELVLSARFAARGSAPGALSVPDGLIAVSIALDDPSHVGSFAIVGSKVAVFDTFNIRESGTDPSAGSGGPTGLAPAGDHLQDRHEFLRATRLLIPSVEVLAVGAGTAVDAPVQPSQQSSPQLNPMDIAKGDTVLFTLAVTQRQAELLVHASRTGTLTFALLGPGASATPGGVDDRTLLER
jgi:pilus assembly protein CpaB